MSETIGFIGLGHLGLPMATNLLKAGYVLRVYNRTASKADSLVAEGAHLASRPVDAVTTGGIVATIVWDDVALENVVTCLLLNRSRIQLRPPSFSSDYFSLPWKDFGQQDALDFFIPINTTIG